MPDSSKQHATQMWEADYEGPMGLAFSREGYARDPEKFLVPLCSDLYGGRRNGELRAELRTHLHELIARITEEPEAFRARHNFELAAADECDVICAVLTYAIRNPSWHDDMLSREVPSITDLDTLVGQLIGRGVHWSFDERNRNHTYSFMLLHQIRYGLRLKKISGSNVRYLLNQIALCAPYIPEREQKARVYRSLAILSLSRIDSFVHGVHYAYITLTMRGLPKDVRRKNLAVLIPGWIAEKLLLM